jgi:perosamine synthetase
MPRRIIGHRDLDLIGQVLGSGRLSSLDGGEFVPRFEAAFAAAHGAAHGVALNCAMSALHASLIVAGAGAGDEVLCDPVVVFGAVAAMYNNSVPVFVDVDPVTWNMNPDLIEDRITDRAKAIIVTHMCGLPAPVDRITEIAHRHGLLVIEDCAHATLTRYKGRCVGAWGDIGCFSFQASKQLSLGDGGMAITNRKDLAQRLALHGGAPTFHSVALGLHFNYRMPEIVAAMGLAQLEAMPEYLRQLRWAARKYDGAVAGCPWITLQRGPDEAEHSFHLWGATFRGEEVGVSRDDFARVLAEEGCTVNLGYTKMPAYRHPLIAERMGYGRGCPLDCPLYEGSANRYPEGTCPTAERLMPNVMLGYTFVPDDAVEADAERLHRAIRRLS